MREILFRAWFENIQKMSYFTLIDMMNGDSIDTPDVIMQRTGLTDKNGVKIYESDIVERKNMYHGKISRCIVEYKKYSDSGGYISIDYLGYEDVSFGEVIGNTRENPHLTP